MTARRTPNHEQLRTIDDWRDSRGRDDATVAEVPSVLRFPWGDGIRGWYSRLREEYYEAIEARRPPRVQRDAAELQRYSAALTELRGRDERLLRAVKVTGPIWEPAAERVARIDRAVRAEADWLAARLGVPPDPPDMPLPPGQERSFYPPDMLVPPEQERDFWGKKIDHDRLDRLAVGRRGADMRPRRLRPSKPKAPGLTTAERRRQSAERRVEGRVVAIVRLLRRKPNLSKNAIRRELGMGKAELANALAHGRDTNRVGMRGSIENPSYFALPDPARKTP
jgi:hypothetical protein